MEVTVEVPVEVTVELLLARLRAAGFEAESVRAAPGGVVALAGMATLRDGSRVFAKTLRSAGSDLFEIEAAGLRALRELGGVTTPEVLAVTPDLLVLEPLPPRREDDERFWEELALALAGLHAATAGERFGWHRDGWLGRLRQDNTWDDDGHAWFARRRILRWLTEPLVAAALDREDRAALERLCAALPDLLPPAPPVLTHGDLWRENILCGPTGAPALIDPAVSYSFAEADLSMLWCSPRPPAAQRFFEVYAAPAPLPSGWQERMPLYHLRELLSSIAHDDNARECAEAVREIVAPF
ncbi:Ribulosamine/erythrulosamine 3-kinase potentially involved in protein deglycation [[Actinomadura] parvosata subsp. kistnae]|nr:Ribulosamine/erythrulosamine 3-kinase potentially involved in protein deglycation [Actinomadura parvosata subsp. kistnae]